MCVRAGDQREEEEEVFVVTAWLQGTDLEKATHKKKTYFVGLTVPKQQWPC